MDNKGKTILIVDDAPENISVLDGLLKEVYKTRIATNGLSALKAVNSGALPDLILLDVMMPEMDGYEVCEKLKSDSITRDIPVIFLTAMSDTKDERDGLSLGAVDYISKPIKSSILLQRVKNHLELKEARDQLKRQNKILEERVVERTRKLFQLQDVAMVAMGSLAEARDPETGNHIHRTQRYLKVLAEKLQNHPRFEDVLSNENISLMYKSAPLHDIGKVGVPDHILLKPGKLTETEFEEMKKHTVYGYEALVEAEKYLDDEESFLRFAKEISLSHQEKWDGSGYPQGLKGDEIPVSARLMAAADVYDALISERVYKVAFSHEEAVEFISSGKGSHFDPDVVDAFMEIKQKFYQISQEFRDD